MRIEVLWKNQASGQVEALEVEPEGVTGSEQGKLCVRDVLARLPDELRQRVAKGELALASHGQSRSPESLLVAGDRLELLGTIKMDARAERAARVKQVRARQRGPYNRSYSGTAPGKAGQADKKNSVSD